MRIGDGHAAVIGDETCRNHCSQGVEGREGARSRTIRKPEYLPGRASHVVFGGKAVKVGVENPVLLPKAGIFIFRAYEPNPAEAQDWKQEPVDLPHPRSGDPSRLHPLRLRSVFRR